MQRTDLEGCDLAHAVDVRWLTLGAFLVVTVVGMPPAAAQQADVVVHLLVIEGVINAFTERYLADDLARANCELLGRLVPLVALSTRATCPAAGETRRFGRAAVTRQRRPDQRVGPLPA